MARMASCRVRAAARHDHVSMRRRRRRSMPSGRCMARFTAGIATIGPRVVRCCRRAGRRLCVSGRSGSQARPAVRRVIPSQAGGWWRTVRAWPTGAGRDDAAVPPRHPSRVLPADPRRTLGLSGRATGQVVPHRRPDSGPGAPAGKASGLNTASLVISRRGDQVLPAAKAGSCISGGACGAGAPPQIMPGTGSSRSLPAG